MLSRSRVPALSIVMLLIAGTIGSALAQDNQAIHDEISSEMVDIRGLELLAPINVEVKTREQLREETRQDLATDYPESERNNDQRVLVAFGLMSPEQDLGEVYVELLGEQVAGYYDPSTDEMVVVASSDGEGLSALDQVTFAHEVVHALQDQHFDLESYSDQRIEGNSDESLAITALIEGDATVAQIDFILSNADLARDFLFELGGTDEQSSAALDAAPPILSATLLFPYNQGQVFVQYLYDEGGWELVNEAYQNPPTTTEQILHPEKYTEGEVAEVVEVLDLSTLLGADWATLDEDSMGEFQLSVLLGDGDLTEKQVERASEGWAGDSYVVSGTNEDVAIVWESSWESEEDAAEFMRALAIREGGRLDAEISEEGDSIVLTGDGLTVMIVQDGSGVTYIQAPDRETVDTIVANMP
jgi:hypothetical protein